MERAGDGARPGAARIFVGLFLLAIVSGGLYYGRKASGKAIAGIEQYPYRTPRFSQLVAESYQYGRAGDPRDFYRWLEGRYEAASSTGATPPSSRRTRLERLLTAKRAELGAIEDRARRAAVEKELCAWLHRMVKRTIPRFDLDRGFEFFNARQRGERQCFLQSVLIAGLLQAMGIDSGVAMVYRNDRGEEINNGHAVTLVKLASGRDLLVDASHAEPFARQQGLLVRAPKDRYVDPVYAANSPEIVAYRAAAGGARLATAGVRDLSYNFVRSQFWYYRGERAPGGPIARTRTPEGLDAASRALRTSVKIYGKNALALYMLGRVEWDGGRQEEARRTLQQACALYEQCGRLLDGPKQYLARAGGSLSGRAGVP
jgi:hypothetical protein